MLDLQEIRTPTYLSEIRKQTMGITTLNPYIVKPNDVSPQPRLVYVELMKSVVDQGIFQMYEQPIQFINLPFSLNLINHNEKLYKSKKPKIWFF